MLQDSAQAVDFKVDRYFGEGQVLPVNKLMASVKNNRTQPHGSALNA
jgi:hypothetical protein